MVHGQTIARSWCTGPNGLSLGTLAPVFQVLVPWPRSSVELSRLVSNMPMGQGAGVRGQEVVHVGAANVR